MMGLAHNWTFSEWVASARIARCCKFTIIHIVIAVAVVELSALFWHPPTPVKRRATVIADMPLTVRETAMAPLVAKGRKRIRVWEVYVCNTPDVARWCGIFQPMCSISYVIDEVGFGMSFGDEPNFAGMVEEPAMRVAIGQRLADLDRPVEAANVIANACIRRIDWTVVQYDLRYVITWTTRACGLTMGICLLKRMWDAGLESRRATGRCWKCGYTLGVTRASMCPECGQPL